MENVNPKQENISVIGGIERKIKTKEKYLNKSLVSRHIHPSNCLSSRTLQTDGSCLLLCRSGESRDAAVVNEFEKNLLLELAN